MDNERARISGIREKLLSWLQTYGKATLQLEQLIALFEHDSVQYREFAEAVAALETEGLLVPVGAAGRNGKRPSLANRYRVGTGKLNRDYRHRLQQLRLALHPDIGLDAYFGLGEAILEADLPWLERIDRRLRTEGLPREPANAPERSFELAGDEKWLTEGGGRAVLERIGLWDKLLVQPAYEPLMLAVNTALLASAPSDGACLHLIVENKTTFHALLPVLGETSFHTLIYGCGNKIVGNIGLFPQQVPLPGRTSVFYYFGDIDHSGIGIWQEVAARCGAIPALPFYEACLSRPWPSGKTNQPRRDGAVEEFAGYFPPEQRDRLHACLRAGGYYPQETLTTQELRSIWRNGLWKAWKPLT
ncbi:Wadjet anti-phage system protein JetD domain-containing protein [Paenibacillus hodogayensis]|uniref:Wadjet anti-phage system protein JetD domain-containing protein n=1 Tax=Paenibacillus hodogayensis TaxID=279208 RepID=A0ABV5VV56_9BACL